MKKSFFRIGVIAERTRAYSRAILEGIGDFVSTQSNWQMDLLEAEQLKDPKARSKYDGFIVRILDDKTEDLLVSTGKPVIDIYRRQERVTFTALHTDFNALAKMVVDFYADRLFTTIAYCGIPGAYYSDRCERALATATAERNMNLIPYRPRLRKAVSHHVVLNERMDSIADSASLRTWLRSLPKPIAVFCNNDYRATQVIKCCGELGLRVPTDIAVLGSNNDILLCSCASTQISSIDLNAKAIGHHACQFLAEAFAHPAARLTPRFHEHPPFRIIERTSTDVFRCSNPWLSDALIYIRRNISSGINFADVVRHIGCSHVTANQVFRAELGRTIHQEIIHQRLAFACKLLRETNDSAAKIALESGFSNPQYFSKVFLRTYGKTPNAWRRLHSALQQNHFTFSTFNSKMKMPRLSTTVKSVRPNDCCVSWLTRKPDALRSV